MTDADPAPYALIDARIKELADWRGATLARIRALIHDAIPDVVEEWKWRGVPVWSHHGILCTGETYKSVVKLTFAKGASLDDPTRLFNASLDGNTRRAIDIHENETIDAAAFKTLIQAAARFNAKPAAELHSAQQGPSSKEKPRRHRSRNSNSHANAALFSAPLVGQGSSQPPG